MTAFLLAHAALIKLAVAVSLLAGLAGLQSALPARGDARLIRWRVNLGVIAVSTLVTRLLLPVSATAVAIWAHTRGLGLFNQVSIPLAWSFGIAVVALDGAIYWQHRAFHAFAVLWRIHRVHHTDIGFDVSLGLRFHPFEILLSTLFKLGVVVALGSAPIAVVVYELVLLSMSLFTHADVALPLRLDAFLRWLIVTPDWHRVHHSVHPAETNSNYGNWLSVWDRIFGTYIARPRDGHRGMRIGLQDHREPRQQTLLAALVLPLLDEPVALENHDA
ncbi:MAG: sterol desaturase family protein [Proteobacteria bacterium]|nr:sterol desaturase family protein [Pseudomonadota bacterium]